MWYQTFTPVILILHLALLIYLFILNFKIIKKYFSKIKKETWILLFLLFLVGFLLRNVEYHPFEYIYWAGEPIHEYANYLTKSGEWVNQCKFGNYEHCNFYIGAIFPPGYPFLISIFYYVVGFNSLYPVIGLAFLSSLTVILVFLVSYLLFKNEETALFSSFIFTFIPLNVITTQIPEIRHASLFFIALSVLFYLIALREKKFKFWLLLTVIFSYSIWVRQENSILLIPMILGFFIFRPKIKLKDLISLKFLIIILIFLLLQLPVQYWIIFVKPLSHVERQYGALFSISNFLYQSPQHIQVLLNQHQAVNNFKWGNICSIPSSLFFFGSLLCLFIKKVRKSMIFLFSLFMIYFVLLSSYLGCEFSIFHCDHIFRYSILLHFTYAILAGVALYSLVKLLKNRYMKIGVTFFILLLIILFSAIPVPNGLFQDNKVYNPGIVKLAELTPKNSTLITEDAILVRSDVLEDNRRVTIAPNVFCDPDFEITSENLFYIVRNEGITHYGECSPFEIINKTYDLKLVAKEGEEKLYKIG